MTRAVHFSLRALFVDDLGKTRDGGYGWSMEVAGPGCLLDFDVLYDQHRLRLARLLTDGLSLNGTRKISFRYVVARKDATASGTTECVGSSEIRTHDRRSALNFLDRGWIKHRRTLARFASQERP